MKHTDNEMKIGTNLYRTLCKGYKSFSLLEYKSRHNITLLTTFDAHDVTEQ